MSLRIARIVLNTRDAQALARFFVDALGFEGDGLTVSLGGVPVDLRAVDAPIERAPGWSPRFQHFAIVVPDIADAMRRLATSSGWTPISTDGPQRLPANTGGVTAFKFRDADGHPLELLALPDPIAARIDHSAISVADVARSVAFYETLGLYVTGRSLNVGIEQQRLDAIDDAEVDVVALTPSGAAKPHLELLGYRGARDRSEGPAAIDDVVATRLVLAFPHDDARQSVIAQHADRIVKHCGSVLLSDPDGHLLELVVDPSTDPAPC